MGFHQRRQRKGPKLGRSTMSGTSVNGYMGPCTTEVGKGLEHAMMLVVEW